MFEQTFVADAGTQNPWTVIAGLTGQLFALGLLILMPLMYTDRIPVFRFIDLQISPPSGKPPAPPPHETPRVATQPAQAQSRFVDPNKLTAYTRIPPKALNLVDQISATAAAAESSFVPGAIYDANAVPTGIPFSIGKALPPPPEPKSQPAKAPAVRTPDRIRIGGLVLSAKIVRKVIPIYPAMARQPRVSGTVQLLGVIGKDGTVQQLQVISGHPLLVSAAVEAVKQWLYRPTLLNGEPVEVVAPIDVNFTLAQ